MLDCSCRMTRVKQSQLELNAQIDYVFWLNITRKIKKWGGYVEEGREWGDKPVEAWWYKPRPSTNRNRRRTSSRSRPHSLRYGSAALDWRQQNLIFLCLSAAIIFFTPATFINLEFQTNCDKNQNKRTNWLPFFSVNRRTSSNALGDKKKKISM